MCEPYLGRRRALVSALLLALPLISVGAEDIETMSEVAVQAKTTQETALGPTEGYLGSRVSTATKTDSLLIETPQSISVITNQQLMDQGSATLQESVRYAVGVTPEAYGLDNRGDWLFIRGIDATQIKDGLRTETGTFGTPRPDAYFAERVEILRGPSSVLFGQASPGGLVNYVSKRPQAESAHELTIEYGSRDFKQVRFDSTGTISDDGQVLYRLVGAIKDADLQSDHSENKRYQIAPSITLKPSEQTQLTLLMNFQKDDTDGATSSFPPHVGTLVSSPNGKIGTDFFSGEPGFDQYNTESTSVGWEFLHEFNDSWLVRQNARYTNATLDYNSIYPNVFPFTPGLAQTSFFLDAAQRTVARYGYSRTIESDGWAIDNQVQAKFNIGSMKNTLLVGLDYRRTTIEEASGFTFIATPFDIFDPVYGNITAADIPTLTPSDDVENKQLGFYLQDQIKFGDHLTVVAGLRRDHAQVQTKDGVSQVQEDKETTGRLGAVYEFENGLAPYVSYSQSFVPIIGTNFYGDAYKPKEGKQVEVGLRYQPINSNSVYTLSFYDLKEKNYLTNDPTNVNNQLQGGEIHSYGVELDAMANLTDSIDLIANASYTHARTDTEKDVAGRKGPYVSEVHPYTASVWGTYKFAIGDISGFKVGAGARYIGENSDETGELDVPSVTLFDAMFSYENNKWRAAVNANNLTDKTYIASCLSRGDCWYGSRAKVVGSLTYKF